VAVIVKTQSISDTAVRYYACVVQVETVGATTLTLDNAGRWGTADNDQCDQVRTDTAVSSADSTAMVYRFTARAYRIDPNRRSLAVLQVSRTAAFGNDWEDLAVGFTDLQVASRWDDTNDVAAVGVDTNDPRREWYSDDTQATMSAAINTGGTPYQLASYATTTRPVMVEARVTLVVRTHTKIDIVPSQATPQLSDVARPGNNDLGDRDAVQLDGVADAARPDELKGDHIYRYATMGTDLRNLGVGL
jgi:hypothetical protein